MDEEECFVLCACLINVFNEPHLNGGDLKNRWAIMAPLEKYKRGDFCLTELNRRFVFQSESIVDIRGDRLEHYAMS